MSDFIPGRPVGASDRVDEALERHKERLEKTYGAKASEVKAMREANPDMGMHDAKRAVERLSKWYGKIVCDEGVLTWETFDTEQEAQAYAKGAEAGIAQADPEQDFLSVYVDQIEPVEE